jgi:hypothetical protein
MWPFWPTRPRWSDAPALLSPSHWRAGPPCRNCAHVARAHRNCYPFTDRWAHLLNFVNKLAEEARSGGISPGSVDRLWAELDPWGYKKNSPTKRTSPPSSEPKSLHHQNRGTCLALSPHPGRRTSVVGGIPDHQRQAHDFGSEAFTGARLGLPGTSSGTGGGVGARDCSSVARDPAGARFSALRHEPRDRHHNPRYDCRLCVCLDIL